MQIGMAHKDEFRFLVDVTKKRVASAYFAP